MFDIKDIRLDGGRLCLDFINTVHDRFEEPQRDYINSIDDLITWSVKTDILDGESRNIVMNSVKSNPGKSIDFHGHSLGLRELLYSMFLEIAHGRTIKNADLSKFNRTLSGTLSKLKVEQNKLVFTAQWSIKAKDFDKIILPIVKDAYDLLLLNRSERIRECPKCGWLFYDVSKNGRRKWCSMETCGSRAKANEWYNRQKR